MSALDTIQKLGIGDWARGAVGAAISGGTGSISAGFAAATTDFDHFNLGPGREHMFHLMWITFCFSAIVSMAKFLQMHPLPDAVTVAQTSHTETKVGDTIVTENKTSQTTVTTPKP